MKNTKDAKTKKTYTLDEKTIAKMSELHERRVGLETISSRGASMTQIVRDAVDMLFRYEVLRESIIHPTDVEGRQYVQPQPQRNKFDGISPRINLRIGDANG